MSQCLFDAETPEELLELFRLSSRTLWRAWDKTQNPDLWLAWGKVVEACQLLYRCEMKAQVH